MEGAATDTRKTRAAKPDELNKRLAVLRTVRAPWESLWQELAAFIMPRRAYGLGGSVSPSVEKESRLFDITAVQGNMTLANGQLAWMTPLESSWFSYVPGVVARKSEEEKRYLSEATDAIRNELAVSYFYNSVHEFYLDRGGFGISCLYLEPGKRNRLNCQFWPVGTYFIAADDENIVDTIFREVKWTPRQAAQKFGKANISPKAREALEKGGDGADQPMPYVHAIYPRRDDERDVTRIDGANMPWASVYYEKESSHICRESGYEEFPCMVSRYLEWGTGGELYGWAPSFAALPEARQLNFLQKMMDALAEKMAFPPMLAPDELEGEVDANANGITYFSRELVNHLPRPLQENNRYDIGLERVKERQEAINKAFHVDLFSMFAQLDKQMTAREVMERSSEKLIQFSPTFARMVTEFLNPFLKRSFSIGIRDGWLPRPPASLLQPLPGGMGVGYDPPNIQYSSRIALALRSLPTLAYHRTLERVSMLAAVVPGVLDVYDFDKAERDASMADGVPTEWIRKEKDVEGMRQARAAEAAQQQQAAQAQGAAEAAAKLGGIPAGSPVGRAIGDQMEGMGEAA